MPSGRQLVTGGSGYFGSVMARELLDRGHDVRVFDLTDAPDRPADVELVTGDIRRAADVARAVEGVEVIHHNVAQVPLAKNADLFWSVNRDGVRVLLEAAQKAGVKKVVYTSSSAVFGKPKSNPVTEATLPAPGEEYGRAKLAGEDICHEFAEQGLDVSIVRPRTIMGPGRLGIMQIVFEWVYGGFNVPVLGRGDNRYQFVHADDLADACIRAADRPAPDGRADVYNIGAEEFGTMRETLEALIAHAGTKSRVRSVPKTPAVLGMNATNRLGLSPLGTYHALMYGEEMYFDVCKAERELSWQARYSNAEMFAHAYDWYIENRDRVRAAKGVSHHRSPVRQRILNLVKHVL